VVSLRLGRQLSLFVTQVWADDVDLDERPEHSVRYPLDVVYGNHCNQTATTILITITVFQQIFYRSFLVPQRLLSQLLPSQILTH